MILEAMAGHDMYLHHVFCGTTGSLNDLNVLGLSTIRSKYVNSGAEDMGYEVNGETVKGAYIQADGIYPKHTYFVKTIPLPQT